MERSKTNFKDSVIPRYVKYIFLLYCRPPVIPLPGGVHTASHVNTNRLCVSCSSLLMSTMHESSVESLVCLLPQVLHTSITM